MSLLILTCVYVRMWMLWPYLTIVHFLDIETKIRLGRVLFYALVSRKLFLLQFWGAEKDTSRLESAIFEDLNRYCWSQQNNANGMANQTNNTDGQVMITLSFTLYSLVKFSKTKTCFSLSDLHVNRAKWHRTLATDRQYPRSANTCPRFR